jgi:hypothetical protein
MAGGWIFINAGIEGVCMLKSILMVWVLAQNLAVTQEAYEEYLGYRLVDEGYIEDTLALAIERPELAGQPYVTLMPAAGPQVGIRLVNGAEPGLSADATRRLECDRTVGSGPRRAEAKTRRVRFYALARTRLFDRTKKYFGDAGYGAQWELFYLTHMIDPTQSVLQPQSSSCTGWANVHHGDGKPRFI